MKRVNEFSEVFQGRIARLLFQDEAFAQNAVGMLKPTLFENPIHAWVSKTVRAAHANGNHPSLAYMEHELQKAARVGTVRKDEVEVYSKFVKRLKKPVPERNYVKKEVQDFLQNQIIKKFILESVDTNLPQRKWTEIKKGMLDIIDFDVTGDNNIGTRVGDSWKQRIDQRENQEMDGITTGLIELDRLMLRGGMTDGQVAVVIAPTGRGKTNFLINVTRAAVLEGVPTVYYSLELDELSIATRMDAAFTSIPMNLLKSNPVEVRRAWKRLSSRVSDSLIVKGFPTGSASTVDLKAHLRQLERIAFYPKLIIIDYIDLMKPRLVFGDSSYETQGQLYVDVRGLMGEMKATCWTGAQGNRSSMDPENDGEVDLHHMADSVKKAFVADLVGGIAQSAKEEKSGRARFVLLKNRNGPAWREIKMRVDHSKASFRPLI